MINDIGDMLIAKPMQKNRSDVILLDHGPGPGIIPLSQHVIVEPVGKPRMTKRDKWSKRAGVEKYFAFKDQIRLSKLQIPQAGAYVHFFITMPKSWSKKKKDKMVYQPHQQKPDIDNLIKALLDAVFDDDSGVWLIKAEKRWARKGCIIVGIE